MNKILITVVLLVVLSVGALAAYLLTTKTPILPVACTQEAKICPDGTSVGRTGPNCEFASCPAVSAATTTPEKESDTAALNQRIYKFGVHITPLEVIEDSRCPMGVYCIQAGTVRLKARLEDGKHSEIVTFDIGSPVSFGNKHVALMSVLPPKTQKPLAPSDYRFTFSVAYGMGGDAPDGGVGTL